MDVGKVPLCALFTATRWPTRIPDLSIFFPDKPSAGPFDMILWQAIEACASYGCTDDLNAYHNQLLFWVRSHHPGYEANTVEWIRQVRARDDLTEPMCMNMLRNHVTGQMLDRMRHLPEDDVPALLDEVNRLRSVGVSRSVKPVDLFANDGRDVLVRMPRVHLPGMTVLNDLFRGLPPPGTVTLFVQPRKSGKTLLSLYTCSRCVEVGIPVLYMNFEQDARGDLSRRVFTLMSGCPMSEFENVESLSECRPEVRRKVYDAKPAWDEYFTMLDMTRLSEEGLMHRGSDSLHTIITQMFLRQGRPAPGLIIVDWWQKMWDLCTSSFGRSEMSNSSRARQLEGMQFLKLKVLAGILDSRVFVFQQMRYALAGAADDINRLSVNDAAENRGLSAFADAGVVSTRKRAEDNSIQFKLDLDRNQQDGAIYAYIIDGPLQILRPFDFRDQAIPDARPERDPTAAMDIS